MEQTELEKALEILTKTKRLSVTAIAKKIGISREAFYTWQREKPKHAKMLKALQEAYPEYLGEGAELSGNVEQKYIALLEKQVRRLESEADDLRKQNEENLQRVVEEMKSLVNGLKK